MNLKYSYHYAYESIGQMYDRHLVIENTSSTKTLCGLEFHLQRHKKPIGSVVKCQYCYEMKNHIKKSH